MFTIRIIITTEHILIKYWKNQLLECIQWWALQWPSHAGIHSPEASRLQWDGKDFVGFWPKRALTVSKKKKETLQGQHQIAVLDAVDGVLTHLFVLQDRRQGNAEEEEKAVDQVFEQVVVVVLVLWRVPERDAQVKAQHYQGYCWRNAWKEWFILTTSNSR